MHRRGRAEKQRQEQEERSHTFGHAVQEQEYGGWNSGDDDPESRYSAGPASVPLSTTVWEALKMLGRFLMFVLDVLSMFL